MPKLVYPSFRRGLVNEDSRARLSDGYLEKLSEAENVFVATDNSLRRRPPLVQPEDSALTQLRNIVDYQASDSKLYVLTNVDETEIEDLPESLQRILGIEVFLGPRNLSQIYSLTDGQLRGETEVSLDSGVADVSLRAYVQKIHVFDVETKEELEDEGYILATVRHEITADHQGAQVSITAKRAATAGVLPAEYDPRDVEEPAVALIYKGIGSDAQHLGSAHTVPFKRPNQAIPAVVSSRVEDPRVQFSPVLEESPEGQSEFLTTDPNDVLAPLDDLDVHPLGGLSFLFAGLLYRLEDNVLSCENGNSLFPDLSTTTMKNLRTFVEDNKLESDVTLPIKCLYIPAQHNPDSGDPTNYTQKELQDALGSRLVKNIGDRGFTTPVGIELLLGANEMVGFDYTVFQQLFPALQPVYKNMKQVVGYYQNPATGAVNMYPDVKLLVPNSDINGAGTYYPLYNTNGQNRAAIAMSSLPKLNFAGEAFRTVGAGTTEFENGSGIAAGGLGVTVALYSNLSITRDTTSGDLTTADTTTQVPTGFLYFYVDYSSDAAVSYFDGIDLLSGFSASGERYHAAILRKGSATRIKPAVTMEQILATAISTVKPDGSDAKTLYTQTELKPSEERHLVFPFGPALTATERFATPAYYVSQTPNEGAAVHTWSLGAASVTEIDGSNLTFDNNQIMTRYLVLPTTYKTNTGKLHLLQGRAAISDRNQVHFSEVGELSNFSNPLARYWDSFVTASRSYNVLQNSGIEVQDVDAVVGTLPTDPETREFKDSTGKATEVVAVLGDSPNRTFIGTTNSIHRVLPSSLAGSQLGLQIDKIADYGITSNFASDSTYTVAALDDKVVVLRYYEEASGYTVDVLNEETQLQDLDTVVAMVGKHKLMLFHKENTNVVYCMAVGSDRRFKGFSRFTFADTIKKIKAVSSDIVGCLITDGTYAELDFRANIDTVYEDKVGGQARLFESRIATLPVVIVDRKTSSPDYTVIPRALSLSCHGFVDFTLTIVDDANEDVTEEHIRYPDRGQIDNTQRFSGIFTKKGLGRTNSDSPRIRITKRDKKYLSISSMILTVGGN